MANERLPEMIQAALAGLSDEALLLLRSLKMASEPVRALTLGTAPKELRDELEFQALTRQNASATPELTRLGAAAVNTVKPLTDDE